MNLNKTTQSGTHLTVKTQFWITKTVFGNGVHPDKESADSYVSYVNSMKEPRDFPVTVEHYSPGQVFTYLGNLRDPFPGPAHFHSICLLDPRGELMTTHTLKQTNKFFKL